MLGYLSLGLMSLSGCTKNEPIVDPPLVLVDTIAVETTLPASIRATDDLPVTVSGVNGCRVFDKFSVVSHTNSKLELYVLAKTLTPCPAVPGAARFEQTFVDKTTTPRTNPFEIWINGSKIGTVTIK